MDTESSTQTVSVPSASEGESSSPVLPSPAAEGGGGGEMIPPPAKHSLLKGANLQQKTEQFVLGSAGLTSNAARGALDKLATSLVPAVAKAVLRRIVPRLR